MITKQRMDYLKNTIKKQKEEIKVLKGKNNALNIELEKYKKKSEELCFYIQKYNTIISSIENMRSEYDTLRNRILKI